MTDLTRVSGRITFLPLDVRPLLNRKRIQSHYPGIRWKIRHHLPPSNLSKHGHGDRIVSHYANVAGTIELNRVFAGMVIVAKGCIQFIGSLLASWPDSTHPEYCAGKAALDVYVRDTKIAMRPLGVDVFMFSPKRP